MYARNPNIPLFFSARQIMLLYLKYVTGVLPFVHLKETALELPLFTATRLQHMQEHRSIDRTSLSVRGIVTRLVLFVHHRISTSPSLIRHLQARNIRVIFWVLNTDEEFEEAFNYGVDGVMTDAPTTLMEYVRKRDQRMESSKQK